ncbi:cyclin-dependent kinase 2-associated protein 1-like [Salvelinus alpinus]
MSGVEVVHSSSTSISTPQSYRPVVNDYGPSLGFSQSSSGSQVPQSKYAELLAIIEEGLQIITDYKGKTSHIADTDALLLDKLNTFFAGFEENTVPPARATTAHEDCELSFSVADFDVSWTLELKCVFIFSFSFEGIIHARGLIRECLAETERNARL